MVHPSTVRELIEKLQTLDPNTEIGVSHPNHDYCQSSTYERISIEERTVWKTHRNGWTVVYDEDNLAPDDVTKRVLVIS